MITLTLRFFAWLWSLKGRLGPCRHKRRIVCKQVRDGVPYVKTFCEDCEYKDEGHVHGDLVGWVEGIEHIHEK